MPKVRGTANISENGQKEKEKARRARVSQSDIPRMSLDEAIRVAKALRDEFGSKPTAPFLVANALDTSPSSSRFRDICGASIAYGLTSGGVNAKEIALEELGRRVVSPLIEGEDETAKVEAALRPKILREFFERYDGAKFPQERIASNVLIEMGVQQGRIDGVLKLILETGETAGLLHQTKTGQFVSIDSASVVAEADKTADSEEMAVDDEVSVPAAPSLDATRENGVGPKVPQVFISHGNNEQVVSQIKVILTFGKFAPVVAEEHETTSKPVPDKILDDMRSCFAGIIHVETEEELLDRDGKTHRKINENVLIEIGASMALYGRNVVLLVQKETQLPSNLQGLYRCEYVGDELDHEATMKLLEAFSAFKPLSEQGYSLESS